MKELASSNPALRTARLTLQIIPLVCALALPAAAQEPAAPAAPEAAAPEAALPTEALPTEAAPPVETPAAQPTVKDIDVKYKGGVSVDRERILSNMRTKVGSPYSPETEAEDIRALMASGDVTDVSTETVDVPGGVKLIVTVEGRPPMGELTFIGNSAIKSDVLRDEVEFKVGKTVDEAQLSKARDTIAQLYREKGFPDASVTYSADNSSQPGFSRVVFTINEGGKGIIDNVSFEGNSAISSSELGGVTESDNRNWLKFWDLSRKLDRDKLDKDVKAIVEHYQNKGYLDAKVLSAEPVRVDDEKVNLVFRISEGAQYSVGNVGITGNKLYETSDLVPVFELESGATYSLDDLRTDMETISDYYGVRGYADARVTPRLDKKPGNVVDVTYSIEEGGQYKVGRINIAGNDATQQKVILQELAIAPGDDYNTIKVKKSRSRLMQLDYFETVDLSPATSDLGAGYKDVNIRVTEKQTGAVQFGAGFSSIDNLVGFVEVTQKNFDATTWPPVGGGQRFRLGIKAGTRRKDFILSLTEPYFMGERLELGGELFYTDKTYLSDRYDQRNIGASISLRKPLSEDTYIRLAYTLQQVEIFNMDEDASEELKKEEGDALQSKITAAWVYDTRNSITAPSTGSKLSLEGGLSGGFLGGDVDTYTLSLAGQKYWSLPWDTVFAIFGEVNVVDATSGEVPIFDRNFLGGANNLRGFEYRDVGPKDKDGEPLGGGTSAWISLEWTFPVVSKVRGALFADAGFVNKDSWDFGTSNFNSDVGFGLRINVPVLGPLKLDYGIPMESDSFNDSGGRFNVSVDYRF